MKKKTRKEEPKELTFLAKMIAILLLVFGLFFSSIYGIFYLIAYASIGFIGYVIFEHYFGIGLIGVIITLVVSIFIHLWLDGDSDKEEKEIKLNRLDK